MNIQKVIDALINNKAYKATQYVSDKLIVRASRKRYKFGGEKKKLPRATDNLEVILTVGRPNYAEREFIKQCKKAGEPFPVKKIQVKI